MQDFVCFGVLLVNGMFEIMSDGLRDGKKARKSFNCTGPAEKIPPPFSARRTRDPKDV